jgi:hypothetical protein
MPTNNPTPQTPSPSGSRSGTEHSSSIEGRVERGSERVERGIEQLASTAADRVREAREQATSGITQQRDQVAQRIRRLGGVLRAGSESIAADDPLAQNLLDLTSDRVERFADYVSDATPSMLADDLQRAARRRPGLFFGGAFLIGLAVGRFVKSSTGARGNTEFDVDLEDEAEYNAGRYDRPYPGRPLSSASPTSDAAAPGSGATPSPYSGGTASSYSGASSSSSYSGGSSSTGSTSGESRSYGSSTPSTPSTTSSAGSYGTRPSSSSVSGSASGGTLPPPYGSTSNPANPSIPASPPVRTQSTNPVGNAATNETHETQRGQGAKS